MITLEQLKQILPLSGRRAVTFCQPLNDAMQEFGIDTPARQASFIAQVGHESGQFVYVREIASGSAYEGREDLGNTHAGDGVRYKGRGLIQVTGHDNYIDCGHALGLDLLANPELLETPENAARSAAWFWRTHGLNELADAGDQRAVCKRVNGSYNGLAERLAFFAVAEKVIV